MNPNIQNRAVRPRFVLVNSNNTPSSDGHVGQVPINAVPNLTPTNKLCKFFKNLLELERNQGRYEESVATIQKYINKEINIDELGNQLKGNATKATLPESLMRSLNSHIGDLRREMFLGRVRIDGINPPPESVLESPGNVIVSSGSQSTNAQPTVTGVGSLRVSTSSINQQPPQLLIRQAQQQIAQNQSQRGSIIRAGSGQITRPQGIPRTVSGSTVALAVAPNSQQAIRNIAPTQPLVRPTHASLIKQEEHLNAGENNSVAQSQSVIQIVSQPTASSQSQVPSISSISSASNTIPITSTLATTTISSIGPSTPSNNITLSSQILNVGNFRAKISSILGNTLSMPDDTVTYVAEAMENFCMNLLEQAAVYACHRHEAFLNDPCYRKVDDVRSQISFLQQMDAEQRLTEEERQKQELIRQSKSRSKADSQEQQRIKDRVRQMQEHERSNEEYSRANMTALKAIGMTNKRKWLDPIVGSGANGQRAEDGSSAGQIKRMDVPASHNILNPNFVLQSGNNTNGALFNTTTQSGLTHTLSGIVSNSNNATSQISSGLQSSSMSNLNSQAGMGGNLIASAASARYRNKRIGVRDFQMVLEKQQKKFHGLRSCKKTLTNYLYAPR